MPSVEKEYVLKQILEENALLFNKVDRLVIHFQSENSKLKEEKLELDLQVGKLNQLVKTQQLQINQLKDKLAKRENIEKIQENQKESIKIVAKKVSESVQVTELKRTIADLITEIDECVALLEEQ